MEFIKKFVNKWIDGSIDKAIDELKWIYLYAKKYWMAMIFYTVIGLVGTLVSFGTSLVSKDLIDIITGHQAGEVVKYFAITIGLAVGNMAFSQLSGAADQFVQRSSKRSFLGN